RCRAAAWTSKVTRRFKTSQKCARGRPRAASLLSTAWLSAAAAANQIGLVDALRRIGELGTLGIVALLVRQHAGRKDIRDDVCRLHSRYRDGQNIAHALARLSQPATLLCHR